MVNAFLGNELEGGPANLYLRRHGARVEWTALLGPRSPGEVRAGRERHRDRRRVVGAALSRVARAGRSRRRRGSGMSRWRTPAGASCRVDLVYAQDVALANYGAVRLNEYYVSQYVDHTPLKHPSRGTVLAVRQNLARRRAPPLALHRIAAAAARASARTHSSFMGFPRAPAGRLPRWKPSACRACAASTSIRWRCCRMRRCRWPPGRAPRSASSHGWSRIIRGSAAPPTSASPIARWRCPKPCLPGTKARRGIGPCGHALQRRTACLPRQPLDAGDADTALRRRPPAVEEEDGELLSFFRADGAHVVLPAKERASLRPHGQILRTGDQLVPDEASLTTTVWMGGVFHSMVTQGHVSINRFLSTTHSYLGLYRSHGQRLFVERDGAWHLLGEPSAFEMTPSGARWLYAQADLLLEVRSWAAVDRHELWLTVRVLDGAPCRFLVSNHVALNGDDGSDAVPARWTRDDEGVIVACLPDTDVGRRFPDGAFRIDAAPETAIERVGGDELLFADGRSRGQPFVVLITAPATSLGLRITGQLVEAPHAEVTADAARSVCKRCGRGRSLLARHDRSAGSGGAGIGGCDARCGHPALAHARRVDPPSRAARPRAVLGRRLGHARRVPGSGRVAALARAHGAGARAVAARVPQPERGRRLAAVVHVLRTRARHPPARLARRHRVLAAARTRAVPAGLRRRRACSTRSCRIFHPEGDAKAQRAQRAGARRARARADRAARDRGYAPGGLRPRRLERLAATGRPGARRASCAVRGPSRCTTRRSTTLAQALRHARPRGARREAARPRWPAYATTSSACSWPTASLPASRAFAATAPWSTGCIRTTATRACSYSLLPMVHGDPRESVHARAGRCGTSS